jgi:hypothetical protein
MGTLFPISSSSTVSSLQGFSTRLDPSSHQASLLKRSPRNHFSARMHFYPRPMTALTFQSMPIAFAKASRPIFKTPTGARATCAKA